MKRTAREDGFALLLVFAMAAAVAILLYTEMPRVAFEAQRTREQMLIDRGEQYQRAIQLYVRKMQRYPARIEDLENTNSIRFLRRRYPDPMTGKDDWRLVHVGPGGVLLDSKVQKQPSPADSKESEKKSENTFVTEAPAVGSSGVGVGVAVGADAQSPAAVRRPSDRAAVSSSTFLGGVIGGVAAADPNAPQQVPSADPAAQPGQYPGVQPGQYPGVQAGQFPGAPPGQYPGLQPGQFPGVQPGQYPGLPVPGQAAQGQIVAFPQPGVPTSQYPNQPASSQTGGQVPVPYQTYVQQSQQPGAAAPNPALEMIRTLLTSPRQGGPVGGVSAQSSGVQLGGGIAGVASKYEAEAIKVYNERTAYDEWEFIYDPKNDRARGGGVGMGVVGGVQGMPGQAGAGAQTGRPGQGLGTGGFGVQPATQQPGFTFPSVGQPGPRPGTGRGR
jgi:type II secretory pathway pseudopilin PulG